MASDGHAVVVIEGLLRYSLRWAKDFETANAAKRNFLRRTKATSPPDTTEPETATDNIETTTNKFPKRGGSKFSPRKEVSEKKESAEKNLLENRTRPSLNGARRNERPTRKFVRKRPGAGGADAIGISSTPAVPSASVSTITRRPGIFANRRKPVPSSTTTTTTTTTTTPIPTTVASSQATTVFEEDESLQDIGDIDAIEDPLLQQRTPKQNTKIQRRPLLTLKDQATDQKPSATNDEDWSRQNAILNQKQDELNTIRNQEESTTQKKSTADDLTAETALAIAAHQLITAPVPSINNFDEDEPTKRSQTTAEYKYTNREFEFPETKTPSYEYQSTPIYKSTVGQSYDTTAYRIPTDYESPKITTDFDAPKSTVTKYETQTDYQNTGDTYSTDFDRPKISTTTYNVPKSYLTDFPTTTQDYVRATSGKDYGVTSDFYATNTYLPKSPSTNYPTNTGSQDFFRTTLGDFSETPTDYSHRIPTSFTARSPNYQTNTVTQEYIRTTAEPFSETGTFSARTSPSYVPKFSTANQEYQTGRGFETTDPIDLRYTTTFAPSKSSPGRFSERTTAVYAETVTDVDSGRVSSDFEARSTPVPRGRSRYEGKSLNSEPGTPSVIPSGTLGVARGTPRTRSEKLIPVTEEDSGYSTVGYSSRSREPSHFTREYLLESPVTKTYDEEYQYISPSSTTPTTPVTKPSRKVFRKKLQRKISTTQRPTSTLPLVTVPQTVTTTPVPLATTPVSLARTPVSLASTSVPLASTPKPRRVPSKKPFEKIAKGESTKAYRPIDTYDYYDDPQDRVVGRYAEGTKVVLHGQGFRFTGHIECLDIGNFPHPTSCKKFISCARMESGALLGWEYVCPKGLSFDPVGGICNWSAGLGCEEKEA